MVKKTSVFIATSIDGYIADRQGGVEWLHAVPNPDNIDMGYATFMADIDALIMGRNTFGTVCNFDIDWPYDKPVYVLSNTMQKMDPQYAGKAEVVSGPLQDVVERIHSKGQLRIYVDGGSTIQSFLREDLIDEMTLTVMPILLGGGVPLFAAMDVPLAFHCTSTQIFLGQVVQQQFVRVR